MIIIYLNTLWVGLCPHIHFTPPHPYLSKLLCTIQTIQLQILFQWDQNYFLQSKYTFHLIYSHTSPSTKYNLWNNLFYFGWVYVHISILLLHSHFHLSKMLFTTQFKLFNYILFQWDQNYFLQSNILFTQYILTPVHPLNTSYIIIYLNTLWVGLCPHTHFTPPQPFPSVQKIILQHNSNYSPTHIISMGSKLFPSVKYTFHSIYSNTSPSTKHNL